jgi:hypothetical protein
MFRLLRWLWTLYQVGEFLLTNTFVVLLLAGLATWAASAQVYAWLTDD